MLRILGEIVENSLAKAKKLHVANIDPEAFTSKAAIRLPIPSATRQVPGSYDYMGYEPLEAVGCAGFIDDRGNVIIASTWDYAQPFQEGVAAVCRNKKWGFIDKTGNVAIPLKWESTGRFSDGLAAVSQSDERAYIDQEGSIIFEMSYSALGSFSEGRVPVMKFIKPDWKYGFIGRDGSLIGELHCGIMSRPFRG